MQHLGNIFLYNNNTVNKELYHQNLEKMGYFLFDTDNLHKFSLYNKEMTPNVLLFDFDGIPRLNSSPPLSASSNVPRFR